MHKLPRNWNRIFDLKSHCIMWNIDKWKEYFKRTVEISSAPVAKAKILKVPYKSLIWKVRPKNLNCTGKTETWLIRRQWHKTHVTASQSNFGRIWIWLKDVLSLYLLIVFENLINSSIRAPWEAQGVDHTWKPDYFFLQN